MNLNVVILSSHMFLSISSSPRNLRTSDFWREVLQNGVVSRRDRVDRELADAPPAGRRVGVLLEVRHPEPRQETQGKKVRRASNVHFTLQHTFISKRLCLRPDVGFTQPLRERIALLSISALKKILRMVL